MAALAQALRDRLRALYAGASLPHRTGPEGFPHATAHERSVELLTRNLSHAQREQFQQRGYFEVIGGDTGKRYRIRKGCQMNIERIDEKGRRSQLMCFLPDRDLPVGDVMLAQKLALELYEAEALKVANTCWDREYELNRLSRLQRR